MDHENSPIMVSGDYVKPRLAEFQNSILVMGSEREGYFFVPAPILRSRSTASLGPNSSYSKKGRISHSLSPPRRPGASTCTNRLVHSIASARDANWSIA